MKKILVTYKIPKEGLKKLYNNFEVIYPQKEVLTKNEIIEQINDCDAVITMFTEPVDKEIINAGKNLKLIANYGVGFNNIDVAFATKKGITVTNTPYSVCEPTAEMAMGLMIDVIRRISWCDRNLRQNPDFKWGVMKNLGSGLYGKTLGIIGMGKIGKSIAKRAKTFGMDIVYNKRNKLTEQEEKEYSAKFLTKEELLKKADVISVNCPFTEETKHLLSHNEFKTMKKGAFLINTARGAIINEIALAEYLQNGHLGGAGLDVFENEPTINPKLLKLDNVVMTPHTGTGTFETRIEISAEVAENIIGFFEGKKNISVVS